MFLFIPDTKLYNNNVANINGDVNFSYLILLYFNICGFLTKHRKFLISIVL